MSTDQVLLGVALTLVLAVGAQLVAGRLRIPALILLLPLGFTAGALTDAVHPDRLLGPAFVPLVSLAVAVILYDAGLGLNLRTLVGHPRRVVRRLIVLGVPITWALGTLAAMLLLPVSRATALMLGAILVVSGPTVVGPLLSFVRPARRLQHILGWEGALIDPVGGTLGAVVFAGIVASTHTGPARQLLEFAGGLVIGLLGGAVGVGLLWLVLRKVAAGEVLGTTAQLAIVIAVAAGCDIVRDDTGLIAAIVMGLGVANLRGFDLPNRRPFFETLVQLIIGLLFISISATVTPASLRHLALPALGLVAVLVVIGRPLVAWVSTVGTDLTRAERAFVGWMAPRGIVAASTASTFSATLVAAKVGGADVILPVTFLVIVVTVTLYGLTAAPVARRLGVVRPARTRPLLVGGHPWVVQLGVALRSVGLEVVLWAGGRQERDRIVAAGLELVPGELVAAAAGSGAELDGITAVLLLTGEDDFNALAGQLLEDTVDGPVYRLAPAVDGQGVVAPYLAGDVLFGRALTRSTVEERANVLVQPGDAAVPAGAELLFVVRGDGLLQPVTATDRPTPDATGSVILLAALEGVNHD